MSIKKKILCTLGPSSLNPQVIYRLTELEVDLFRLNLSHTPLERLEQYVELIKSCSDVPICFDSQGAQVRTGNLAVDQMRLKTGMILNLVHSPLLTDNRQISLYPQDILSQIQVGDLVSMDFDTALLQVIEQLPVHKVRVICGGMIGANKAVSIIDHPPSLPCMSEMDIAAFELGNQLGIKNVALSFTSRRADLEELRKIVGEHVNIIAKIESRLGVQNLDDILSASDAIVIDRGDLSREFALESIPYMQKEIIRSANVSAVPVYVATNLLESMVNNARPTRAEVNDVINTLTDGADGLVLAAETAIGKHPVACASMIKSLIYRFENQVDFRSQEHWIPHSNLVEPHGGKLVQNIIPDDMAEDMDKLPVWEVDELAMIDAKQIATGAFSPLSGFMCRDDLESVLVNNCLSNGDIWTLPVLLQIKDGERFPYDKGEAVVLGLRGEMCALLQVEDVYRYDKKKLCIGCYGTYDSKHPGVKRLLQGSDTFVAGKVSLLNDFFRKRKPYEFSPTQTRLIFQHNQWRRIVGFHTRNVPHLAHEYMQLTAMKKHDCDGLFIHPVIGPKKDGDFTGDIILRAYHSFVKEASLANRVLIGGFTSYSRYAGPREAIFTALCRKNFGCSHFIVGRDHTGVGDFYPQDSARRLFDQLGDIGIQPIFFEEVYYCNSCKRHLEGCEHGIEASRQISGTEVREKINTGEPLPDWFMRKSLYRLIRNEIEKGQPVFCSE